MRSLTAKDAKETKESKSFTARDAKDAKGNDNRKIKSKTCQGRFPGASTPTTYLGVVFMRLVWF